MNPEKTGETAMRVSKRLSFNVAAALFTFALLAVPSPNPTCAQSSCDEYPNTRVSFESISGHVYCGRTGQNCLECYGTAGSGAGGGGASVSTCWSNGSGTVICTDGFGGYYVF